MPKLIKCTLKKTGKELLMHCPNRNCDAELADVDESSGAYFQCPKCGAVFNKNGLIPCVEAEELFPDDIIMAY